MSDSPLSEDCRDWPTDPYALLGVTADDDIKVVKRAYTRLIKLYKPEHHPKEFQLLRNAFDAVQERVDYRQRYEVHRHDDEAASDDGTAIRTPTEPSLPVKETSREVKGIWEAASRGDYSEALAELRTQRVSHAESSLDIGLEYWFAKLGSEAPDNLEPDRRLIQKLLSGNVPYLLSEQLRHTLTQQPELILEFPLPFAAANSENAYVLLHYLELRWEASHRAGREKLIVDDCRELNTALIDQFTTWQEVAFRAVGHLLWSDDHDCYEYGDSLLKWLYANTPVHSYFVYRLESLDTLIEIIPRYRNRVSTIDPRKPNRLLDMLPFFWNSMRGDCYETAVDWLAKAAFRPNDALFDLDFFAKTNARTVGFIHSTLRSIVGEHFGVDVSEIDPSQQVEPADIRPRLRSFLTGISYRNYKSARGAILDFCLENGVTPSRIFDLIDKGADSIYSLFKPQFITFMRNDVGLTVLNDLMALTRIASTKPA